VTVGNASDFTKHSTDVILLQEHLAQLPLLTALAAKTKRTIKQNFMWALGYNVVVLPFAIMGVLTPWQAALGMSLSSLIVVYNSARLLRFRQLN
jgi:Cu2+-exporting ATPase